MYRLGVKTNPSLWEPLSDDLHPAGALNLALAFKTIGDPVRLQMLSCLLSEMPMCVGDFGRELGLPQPLVSHHLGKLADAGILQRSKSGRNVWYWITDGALERLSDVLAVAVD
jgi:ArsR family transcriptional regulator